MLIQHEILSLSYKYIYIVYIFRKISFIHIYNDCGHLQLMLMDENITIGSWLAYGHSTTQ